MNETVRLRAEKARLLGYATFADYRLADTMAKTPAAALGLLRQVWAPARAQALRDAEALQAMIAAEGGNFELKPWDWRYYQEKRRQALYDFDEGALKAHLPLERIIAAAFDVAQRLFGLTFVERSDVDLPHPDARVWSVTDSSGAEIALFIGDYFARRLQAQRRLDGPVARPEPARRRDPADRRQRHEFRARRGRGGVPLEPRRGAHSVSRIRPRAARHAVRRDLSPVVRDACRA